MLSLDSTRVSDVRINQCTSITLRFVVGIVNESCLLYRVKCQALLSHHIVTHQIKTTTTTSSASAAEGVCDGCISLHKEVLNLRHELSELKSNQKVTVKGKKTDVSDVDTVLKNDANVRRFTGLPNKATFNALVNHLSPSANRMQYWVGKKRTITPAYRRRKSKENWPLKTGPLRKRSSKDKFTIAILKLKLNLVKFMAMELKPLIFWPDKELVFTHMPVSMKKKYPSMRCTIACTEDFIERPRKLNLQAMIWFDYKHHNTVKFLVTISPIGMVSFLTKAWGGRTSDRAVTRESGFLNLIDAGDVILADRGFTIREDLLLRGAHLDIPPPSEGLEQMTTADALKTKKIANARIHVERARITSFVSCRRPCLTHWCQ
ncbi:hypothetical protein BSL78_13607 [Apostichopus japonicus]|uniref:DDE Tnp4 domain-containing protein n=1 Tax=Stichopus japonicus TaxID=307972 RepID=A0A2G8KNB5_STIJA|nr:hypothetical protein BSL78_13607 [Apostichopus japonicus]